MPAASTSIRNNKSQNRQLPERKKNHEFQTYEVARFLKEFKITLNIA
jgi:hypothetical protein